jgi:hypothetical protein
MNSSLPDLTVPIESPAAALKESPGFALMAHKKDYDFMFGCSVFGQTMRLAFQGEGSEFFGGIENGAADGTILVFRTQNGVNQIGNYISQLPRYSDSISIFTIGLDGDHYYNEYFHVELANDSGWTFWSRCQNTVGFDGSGGVAIFGNEIHSTVNGFAVYPQAMASVSAAGACICLCAVGTKGTISIHQKSVTSGKLQGAESKQYVDITERGIQEFACDENHVICFWIGKHPDDVPSRFSHPDFAPSEFNLQVFDNVPDYTR